jgi:E3 ubiquitin-protein ligase NRDP1
MVKCWNFDACEKPVNEAIKCMKPSCSETCSTVAALQEKFGNKKAMMDILAGFMKNARSVSPSKNNGNNPPDGIPAPLSVGDLVWDPSKTGGSIVITEGGVQCFLKEQSYLFRTSLTNNGFTSGRHYWEIIADSRTENELKIGVTTNKDFDYNSAFCDHPFGFAYYGNASSTQVWDS